MNQNQSGSNTGGGHGSVKNEKFLGPKFRKQIDSLSKQLRSSQVHFIRCIKPNDDKLPGKMDT